MSKYSEREKRGHFNKLRGHASHVDADLKLLEKLSPNNELLSSPRVSNLGDKLLMALLDLTTSCDIVAFRREFGKHKGLSGDELMVAKYVDNYNKNIVVLIAKYGVDSELDTEEKIKEVFDSLGFTPFIENVASDDNKTLLDMVGCTLQDCNLIETFDELHLEEDISVEEQFRTGILHLITDSIVRRDARHEKEFAEAYQVKLDVYIQKVGADFVFNSVEDVAIMFQMLGLPMPDPQKEGELALTDFIGIPFSELSFSNPSIPKSEDTNVTNRYQSKKKEEVKDDVKKENLEEQKQELEDKESELEDKEQVLEEKESELEDKEQELSEKEEKLSKESKKSKKKAEPKKKNTQK